MILILFPFLMHSVYFLLHLYGKHNSKYFVYDIWLSKISNAHICEGLSVMGKIGNVLSLNDSC